MNRNVLKWSTIVAALVICMSVVLRVANATTVILHPSGNVTAISPNIIPIGTEKTTNWSGDVSTPQPIDPEAKMGPPGWSLVLDSAQYKTTTGGTYVDANGYQVVIASTGGGTHSSGTISIKPVTPGYWKFVFHVHVQFGDTMGNGYSGDSSPATINLTAVAVEKMQYSIAGQSMQDVTGSVIYVLKNKTVAFKAIPSPEDASWPSGKAVWGGSGASGTGSTTSVTFNSQSSTSSDYKTVTAECGNTTSASALVCTVVGNVVSDDPFPGRSTTRFGVAEVLTLSATITPSGVTAANLGGLVWIAQSGNGTLTGTGGNDGNGIYTCYKASESAQLALKRLAGGTSTETADSKNETIVAPTGITQSAMSGIMHNYGSAGLRYQFDYALSPSDVSFSHISVREGGETYHGSGYFSYMEGTPHNVGVWNTVDAGAFSYWATDTHGTRDWYAPPWSTGLYYCDIPIEYRVGAENAINITSVMSWMSIDASGTCNTYKGSTGPVARAVNDATSGY